VWSSSSWGDNDGSAPRFSLSTVQLFSARVVDEEPVLGRDAREVVGFGLLRQVGGVGCHHGVLGRAGLVVVQVALERPPRTKGARRFLSRPRTALQRQSPESPAGYGKALFRSHRGPVHAAAHADYSAVGPVAACIVAATLEMTALTSVTFAAMPEMS
jgi:hypothetical protein